MEGTGAARPLRGRSFYLDLPSGRAARDLALLIGSLGGVTESFLSKEVNYVVSSNKEAKRDKAKTRPEKRSNEASEDAKVMGPMPFSSKGNHPRPHQKPSDTVLISRGKELLQKAMKNQDTCSGSSILASARLWGVQILHVDDMLSYAQQLLRAVSETRKQCQKTEVKCLATGLKTCEGKLKPPFLKVEDQSRQFRPFHHQFKSFPNLNFLAPKSSSPFEPLKSLSNSCRARAVEGCPRGSKGEKSPQSTPVTAPKKKRGFCECCQETFEELQKHLQSPQHKRFALDDSQYAPVDRVITQLSFMEHSAKVLRSCLTDEHSVPQAQVPGEIEMLTAEMGKEREQPEQELFFDVEHDHSLKTKGGPSCPPRDRCSNPSEGGEFKTCSVGAGLTRRVCAAHSTLEEFVIGDTDLGLAPDLGSGACVEDAHVRETTASSSEPHGQQALGPASHLPHTLPAPRKRQLSRQSTQVGKRPRLELGGGGGLSPCEQGAGQTAEPGLPGVLEPGSLPLSTKLSSRPWSSVGLDLCLCRHPGDPASHLEAVSGGFDPTEAAVASTVGECGWSRVNVSSKGEQLRGVKEVTHRNVLRPDVESTRSQTNCLLAPPKLLGAKAGCCCSLCVRAAEKRAPDLPGHGEEQGTCPGLLQPPPRNTQAEHDSSSRFSESDWDVSLLSTLMAEQDGRIQPAEQDLLQRTHVSVRDSGYESQLCSVQKQKSELAWAGKEDKNCWNCCTETKGASFPILETCFGSWTS
ncbi:protein DBF4 homolog B isoform X2 [Melopsittacus undulatus]|uniref:protein DBF4 homolog B isoform X2 n=1 Tax=Melopsittacus undulatus TaxID=13146 RepID=UPI00146C967B|nr:protein DBF4 homolog B isoform X2 [Melopsittacus undulatus]